MRIGLLMGTSSIVDCEKDELVPPLLGKGHLLKNVLI